ncbi:MAG: winged helix-turn-helix domain-containing protein [Pseudomonadota bacterium]
MSPIYISQGFTIYPHRQIIQRGVETIQVRSKTFALLLLLLEKPNEVLSKRYLLDTIWDDVMVDEQVLVQSIRELRKLFGSAEIIQTYPRKGYAWAASVQHRPLEEQKPPQPYLIPFWRRTFALPLAFVTLVVVAALVFYKFIDQTRHAESQTEVVIVLPVKNQISGSDHNWVSLGAMDQLIKSLVSDKNVQVMDTHYVLNLMQHIKLPPVYKTEAVARIFSASGATLIVETQLSGSVEDYRLDYKLHYKNHIERGTLFEANLNDLLRKLALTIAAPNGRPLALADVNSTTTFGNELMARALEKLDAGELELAQSLLVSLKQLEPDNIVARRLLADVFIRQGQLDPATTELTSAVNITNNRESARLHFLLAQVRVQQGVTEEALIILVQAHKLAELNSDVLYQGYIAQLRGSIQQQLGSFAAAEASFKDAIKYHGIIRCPVGVTLTRLQLVNLFSLQGKIDVARDEYIKAKQLVETHQLDYLLSELAKVKASLAAR